MTDTERDPAPGGVGLEETLHILLEIQHIDQRLAELDIPDNVQQFEKLGFQWQPERRQQLIELRSKRASQLDPEVLTHYQGLKDRYGEAIVPIDGGICLGCFMMIPTAWVQNIRQNLSVKTCGHCGRILFWVG